MEEQHTDGQNGAELNHDQNIFQNVSLTFILTNSSTKIM